MISFLKKVFTAYFPAVLLFFYQTLFKQTTNKNMIEKNSCKSSLDSVVLE